MRNYRSSLVSGNHPGEVNTLPSETVPDQALTVQEILLRYASGTLPNIVIGEEYNEDMPDLRGLDYVERANLAKENLQQVSELRAKIDQIQKNPYKKPVKEVDQEQDLKPVE